jgi:GNAT superfamily N-acetyltransferase
MDCVDLWLDGAIARMGRGDQDDLVSLLLRLDQPSRVDRFGAVTSDAAVAAHALRALADADWLGGAVMDSGLCGVVELYSLGARAPGVAEAAFVVEPRWRRRGLATALLRASIRWASGSGITTLRMVFSRSNWPMRKLAGKGTTRFEYSLDEISAEMRVADGVRL